MAWIEKKKRNKNHPRSRFKQGERQSVYQSAQWKKIRAAKLACSPLCEVCLMEGRIREGEHVHHLRSFMGLTDPAERDSVAYDPENLMTVCGRCHGRIHGGDLQGCYSADDLKKRIDGRD